MLSILRIILPQSLPRILARAGAVRRERLAGRALRALAGDWDRQDATCVMLH